ncbi:MAG: hypothetical protein IH897_05165 [Planctomycetes bacterium]|nr:hypothetical protein [Planctomycetota bacterium]
MGCDGGPGRGSWRVHGSLASDRHVGPNKGWASVGVNHDTAAFPVNTIHRRWRNMGQRIYARADSLLITADGGGALACGCVCGNGNCRNSTIVNLISATRTRRLDRLGRPNGNNAHAGIHEGGCDLAESE